MKVLSPPRHLCFKWLHASVDPALCVAAANVRRSAACIISMNTSGLRGVWHEENGPTISGSPPYLPDSGIFNILFAWLGLICFIVPIVISPGDRKHYCHTCGRGDSSFALLGRHFTCPAALPHAKLQRGSATDSWPFMVMFRQMLFNTAGLSGRQECAR